LAEKLILTNPYNFPPFKENYYIKKNDTSCKEPIVKFD